MKDQSKTREQLVDELAELRQRVAELEAGETAHERTEGALRGANEQTVSILESISDGFFALNDELVVTYFNKAAERLLGRTSEQVLGRNLFEAFPEAKGSLFEEKYAWAVRERASTSFGVYFDVEPYENWYEVRVYPYEDGISVYFQVTTERKQVEEALRESEERYRNFVESARDVIYTVSLDGTLTSLNAAFETITGWPRTEWIGKSLESIVHPDDWSLAVDMFQRMLRGEIPPVHKVRVRSAAGEYWLGEFLITPHIRNGEVIGVLGIGRDITERERAEAALLEQTHALRESEERFQTLAKVSPVGVFRTDAEGNYVYVNERWCEITGLTPEEAHGEGWARSLHPQDRERILAEWYRAARESLPFELEYRFQRPDGVTIWVFGQAAVEKGGAWEVVGYVGTITDVTARRRIEEVLERSEAKYYSLVEQAGAGIVIIDVEGRLTFVNRAFFQMIGYSSAELLGQPFIRFLHPDDVERIQTQFLKDFQRPVERHLEYRLLHKDGRIVYCYSNPAAILYQGQVLGASAIIHDITERRQAEEELRRYRDRLEELVEERTIELARTVTEAERLNEQLQQEITERAQAEEALREAHERLKATLGALPDLLFEVDRHGRIYDFRAPRSELLYAPPEEFLGQIVTEILPEEAASIIMNAVVQAAERGQYAGAIYSLDTPAGAGWFELSLAAKGDPRAPDARFVALIRDITERKWAEEELLEKKYIIESASSVIATADLEGSMTYMNPAFLETWGFDDEKEVLGRHFKEFWMVEDQLDEILQALWNKRRWSGEIKARRADGSLFDVQVSAAMVVDKDGNPVSLMSTSVDITGRRQTEEALRFTQFAIDRASDAAFWMGLDARFIYVNDAACRNLGYSREELLTMTVHDIDPDFPTEVWPDHWREVRERGSFTIESRHRAKSGRVYPVEITINFVEFAGQEYNCAFARDITERKRAEEALQRRNRELALLNRAGQTLSSTLELDQVLVTILEEVRHLLSVVAVSIWLVDPVAKEVVCQQASGPGNDIVRGWRLKLGAGIVGWVARHGESMIVPDTRADERYFAGVDQQTGMELRSILSVPLLVRRDVIGVLQVVDAEVGRFGPADLALIEPLAASASVAIENARLHRQVLKHAEQLEQLVQERTAELQAQYARLDAVLRSTADGIVVANAEGEILQANPVAQAWLTQTLSPEETDWLQETVRSLATRAEEQPVETLELAGLDLELSGAPILEPEADAVLRHRLFGPELGEPAAVVAVHDVSHLRALDRMKTRFVTNVSHELRTPIATIKAYAHLMQRTLPDDGKWRQYLDALVQEADRQVQLGEDILRATRIYAGRLELKPRPTSLNELIGMIITGYQGLAQERGVTLEHQSVDPGLAALVDPQQIMQVLNILVEDAVRYTPAGGRVVVSTGTEQAGGTTWATVAVLDTGEAVPAEDLPHLFERFFREEEPRSVRASETGLRLMIVKGIVELHGGRVTVESPSTLLRTGEEGLGSTFTVWLPLAD